MAGPSGVEKETTSPLNISAYKGSDEGHGSNTQGSSEHETLQ